MTISFNSITDIRVPFVAVEFDNSKAQQGPALQKYTSLLLGQRTSAGSAASLSINLVSSEAQARLLFGAGSMLYWMVKSYLANDKVTPLYVACIDDNAAGVKAIWKIATTGSATADGTLALYVHGEYVPVAITNGMTQAQIATAIVAAVNANTDLMFTAAVNGTNTNEADLTFRHKGLTGNEVDLRFNYYDSDKYPAGPTWAVTQPTAGTANPAVSTLLDALPENSYNVIAHPWTDGSSLTAIETELSNRWGPLVQDDGMAIAFKFDTLSNLASLGNGRNSPYSCIHTGGKSAPQTPWQWAAAEAAQISKSAQIDPARPFKTLALSGILAPKITDLFVLSERNTLLYDGIGTCNVVSTAVQIERPITTYKTNAANQADASYLDMNTLFTLSYMRYAFKARMLLRFPRSKLANDGTRFAPGQAIVTPSSAKAEAISLAREWEFNGLMEDVDQFKRDLIVERNASNPNRLDFMLPPNLINQLLNTAAQIQFLL
jgi:phage tail sheath gpL-like